MTLYALCFDNGKYYVESLNSKDLKRLGREHICFSDDLFTRVKHGSHYGNIYHGGQLYANKKSAMLAWYEKKPITINEYNAVKCSLSANNLA